MPSGGATGSVVGAVAVPKPVPGVNWGLALLMSAVLWVILIGIVWWIA